MSQSPPVVFNKPWLNYSDQLRLLESRGLVVSDRQAAEQFLAHVNYYRLSGYCLAFEQSRHQFLTGTTFDQLRESYQLDMSVRGVVDDAPQIIEVDLRTTTASHFGQRYGVYAHADPMAFFNQYRHPGWLNKLREDSDRSKEPFVYHFKRHYTLFPDLAIWVVMEIMSFGMLSQM